mmetsp:Transcript_12162/g.20582  ORF Transcript_12162/g.20582 Transcript_12162/m.20582 type:complete len:119 (+) Transcript_12162:2-358(+)
MEAFIITVSTLVLLQKYARPDSVTYGTMLRACSNLLPRSDSRRHVLVERIFDRARAEGQVSQMVLTQLRFAASPDLYKRLTGRDVQTQLRFNQAPYAWKANVVESSQQRRRRRQRKQN